MQQQITVQYSTVHTSFARCDAALARPDAESLSSRSRCMRIWTSIQHCSSCGLQNCMTTRRAYVNMSVSVHRISTVAVQLRTVVANDQFMVVVVVVQ